VKELLASCDSQELTEWQAFDLIEPYALRADKRIAMLCALAANAAGGKKDGGSFREDDFVPDLDAPEAETLEPSDLQAKARAMFEQAGLIAPEKRT
jgi:hypothetical protein